MFWQGVISGLAGILLVVFLFFIHSLFVVSRMPEDQ